MQWVLFGKIKKFTVLPFALKLLFAEAVIISACVKATLLFLPFRKITLWLGKPGGTHKINNREEGVSLARQLRAVITLCDKYTPWPTECYTRALTAKIMLRRRNIDGTLYFGFQKDSNGQMAGHAWLTSCGIIITGFCDFSKYEVHSCFS